MRLASRQFLGLFSLLAVGLCSFSAPAHSLTVNLRSGNAAPGNPDPLITRLDLASSCGVGYASPFTAAEFNAALSGPPAIVVQFPHPAWGTSIPCDPNAGWIGIDPNASPLSILTAQTFEVNVDSCCFTQATLDFCWLVDDALGDAVNPAGIYLNQVAIPAVQGGNYATQTQVSVDVTSLIHCGRNTLHVYVRDAGCAVSGVMYSATLNVRECIVPVEPATWGSLKARYQ